MDVLNQVDLDRASMWVDQNVNNGDIQAILSKALDQSRDRVLNTQIALGDTDCAFVFRPWGNEIYVSNTEEAGSSRLKLAVAVRAVSSEKDEPKLWEYLHKFEGLDNQTPPKFELIVGGKA